MNWAEGRNRRVATSETKANNTMMRTSAAIATPSAMDEKGPTALLSLIRAMAEAGDRTSRTVATRRETANWPCAVK